MDSRKLSAYGYALAIEVKKFFMNEWTGELDCDQHRALGQALAGCGCGHRRGIGEVVA